MKKNYGDALSSEDVRHCLFSISAQAQVAELVITGMIGEPGEDPRLVALRYCLDDIRTKLEQIAGGETFDRLTEIEEAKRNGGAA